MSRIYAICIDGIKIQPTRNDVKAEYPKLMADFLLDRVLERELEADDAALIYQLLTDNEA